MDTPNIIILDLTDCRYIDELHHRIREAFDFPSWYGENWDAFWDLLREPAPYTIVEIRGLNSLPKELKSSGEMMIKLIQRNKDEWDEYMRTDAQFDRRFDYRIID